METTKKYEYDLATRTLTFARDVRNFLRQIPLNIYNTEDIKQLIRCSGAIGANYLEGNDALGKRDFLMRVKISRKEAKETTYWLQLLSSWIKDELKQEHRRLLKETDELRRILSAIINKTASSKI